MRLHVAASGVRAACARGLGSAIATALDAVLPQQCAACGRVAGAHAVLCTACRDAIPRLSLGLCARCLADGAEPVGCRRHPHFTVWPAWVYDRRAEAVVHALKYHGRPGVAAALGDALAAAGPPLIRADFVIDVPLHPARRRERGYNQSERLADALSATLGVARLPGALVRTRATRAQARLGAHERRRNVRGAFRVCQPAWLEGRKVLVVDDVITTGATFEACLAALRDAGANPVGVALAWAQ